MYNPWMLVRGLVYLLLLACTAGAGTTVSVTLLPADTVMKRLSEGLVAESRREAAVEALFQDSGCTVSLEKVGRHSDNVICDLGGETGDAIVVGAHYDFVSNRGGNGMVDDWSGVAALASLFETLKKSPRHHTFRFVAFAQEESGLGGSEQFVHDRKTNETHGVQAFVNLECLGLSEPKVWANRADRRLAMDLLRAAQATQIPLAGMNVDFVGDDDSRSFLWKRIPVITIHSLTQETFPVLHGPGDQLKAVNGKYYYDAYRLAAFYLAYLDEVWRGGGK